MQMDLYNYKTWIALILTNFSLAMFVLAIIFILLHRLIVGKRVPESEIVYRWMSLFVLGFSLLYVAFFHAFFPDASAAIIGWVPSPFQFEVAMADLAFGILAILSFRASYGFRLATVVGSTIFLWGAAIGHIYQMVVNQNFTMGNAGSWCWLDIVLPIILIICIVKLRPGKLIVV